MGIDSDLIRGHIDTIILKTLIDGDLYGYEICKEVEEKTNGNYQLKQPTLYSCLKRLEDQKLISSYWKDSDIGGRRHYYKLTTKGRQTLDKNQEDWLKSRSIIDSLIYTNNHTVEQNSTKEEILEDTQNNTNEINFDENTYPSAENQVEPLIVEEPEIFDNEEVFQIEHNSPILIENEEVAQIENTPVPLIEDEETLQIEDKNFEPKSSISDNFFDDDDEEETVTNNFSNNPNNYEMSEEMCETHSFDENIKDENNKNNLKHIEEYDTNSNLFEEIDNFDDFSQNLFSNKNLQDELDDFEYSNTSAVQENETDNSTLNVDRENFDASKFFTNGNSYFNSGVQDNYDEESKQPETIEIKEFNAFGSDAFTQKTDETPNFDKIEPLDFEKDEDRDFEMKNDENNFFDYEESNENEFKYEPVDDEENYSNDNGLNNVQFQDDDDKAFTDEIMLSFNNNEDKQDYVNNYSMENSKKLSEELNKNVEYAQDNASMIATKEIEPEKPKTNKIRLDDDFYYESPTSSLKAKSIASLQSDMNKLGIEVKPYVKRDNKSVVSQDYLLTNKIRFLRTSICACIIALLLSFSFIVLSNYSYIDVSGKDTQWIYTIGLLILGAFVVFEGINYLVNPYKKKQSKYAFRLSFLFGLLFFIQALVIIFATNIMLGFVSFTQADYNHIKWIVPSIMSLWFVISPIFYNVLFTAKKCCV